MENTESTTQAASSTSDVVEPNIQEVQQNTQVDDTKAQAKNLQKFKLLVDGQEIEEEIDLNDKDRLTKELQLSRASKKRMAEAVDAKRRAMSIIKEYENNPEELFRKLGSKGHEIAEKILLEKLQGEMMTPEQREVLEMKKKLQAYEDQEKKSKEEKENEVKSAYEAKIAQDFQKKIIEALEKSKLPKSPDTVKRMAQLLKKNLEYGLDLTVEDLVEEVKGEFKGNISSLLQNAEVEQLIELLGPEAMKKIRKYDIEKLKEKNLQQFTKQKSSSSSQQKTQDGLTYAMDLEEWMRGKK